VALKTAGLLLLMARSGLFILFPDSRLFLYDKVFADIGDEQASRPIFPPFLGTCSG
jgi:DNA mismatch repair protein MutS2